MKRIKAIKNGIISNQAEFASDQDAAAWLAEMIQTNSFGKPERWIDGSRLSDAEKAQAVETRVSAGSLGEEITEYKFAAEYSVVEEDLTAEIAAKDARIVALRNQIQQMQAFDVDAATLAQLKPFLKLQRSVILKLVQLVKGSLEGAE